MNLLCATCLFLLVQEPENPISPQAAVTVFNGNAVCGEHWPNALKGFEDQRREMLRRGDVEAPSEHHYGRDDG